MSTVRVHNDGLTKRRWDRPVVVTTRPFRALHHTISDVGLVCGGQMPRPGEVSRAPHGVRCLDARPECRRHVLEVLRQPLRRVFYEYNLPRVLDLAGLAVLAAQFQEVVG